MLACLSCSVFFLEPNPFIYEKLVYLQILAGAVWVIYTTDHIIDGYILKGKSGILRYDLHYKYRYCFISLCSLISVGVLWMIYKNRDTLFFQNGLWLIPVIPVYFILKISGKLKPLIKMIIISLIISTVIVSLYNSQSIISDFFTFERLLMALLVFLNQLVLEHFEFHEDKKVRHQGSEDLYSNLARQIFIWVTVLLIISTALNLNAWPFTFSMFIMALFLRAILHYQNRFRENRLYRYWADFCFVLIWPLFKLSILISNGFIF